MAFDHILLVGFGGPEKREDIWPFLLQVSKGRNIPEPRLREVEHHYELIGGKSPYNEYTFELQNALAQSLKTSGVEIPVFVGMRNWHPFLKETLKEIQAGGFKKGLGVILAAHRTEASCKRYKENVDHAKIEANAPEIEYQYLPAWYENPDFINAQTSRVQGCIQSLNPQELSETKIIFTAHSVPVSMRDGCDFCQYEKEYQRSGELVAQKLGFKDWVCAYQSRSGRPQDPWLEPDVNQVIRQAQAQGKKGVLLIPIGFIFDNVEVIYDLDYEAKQTAESLGLRFLRAKSVMSHPEMIQMFTKLIRDALQKEKSLAPDICKVSI